MADSSLQISRATTTNGSAHIYRLPIASASTDTPRSSQYSNGQSSRSTNSQRYSIQRALGAGNGNRPDLSMLVNSFRHGPQTTFYLRPNTSHGMASQSFGIQPPSAQSHMPTMSNNHGQNTSIHPHFRTKLVCLLRCRFCERVVCRRGMKAILLADSNVELYSTDLPPRGVQLVEDDYMTANCRCKIRDLACMCCGNVIGYHVTQPCETCLDSCNNGHFWMFLSDGVASHDRLDPSGNDTKNEITSGDRPLQWGNLPHSEYDMESSDIYDVTCR